MAEEGEIVLNVSTPNSGPLEVKLDFGENFLKTLPNLENPGELVPQLTQIMKETREALQAITKLVEMLGKYEDDLQTVLQLIKALGNSKTDIQKIISMWQNASSTS